MTHCIRMYSVSLGGDFWMDHLPARPARLLLLSLALLQSLLRGYRVVVFKLRVHIFIEILFPYMFQIVLFWLFFNKNKMWCKMDPLSPFYPKVSIFCLLLKILFILTLFKHFSNFSLIYCIFKGPVQP